MAANKIDMPSEAGLVSTEVQELISHQPNLFIRIGNVIFLFIFLSFLFFSWFIRYPDVIKGSMKLVAINAPKLLASKSNGKLQRLLVSNEEYVIKGTPLAFLQSTASPQQVLSLQSWINNIEQDINHGSFNAHKLGCFPVFNELGELQPAYQEFQNTLKETLQTLPKGYYFHKKQALKVDLNYLVHMGGNVEQQQQLLQQDLELQQKEFNAYEELAKDTIISPMEFNQNKIKVITKKQGMAQMASQLISNNISMNSKEKEVLDLDKFVFDQQQRFRSSLLELKSKTQEWIQQYILLAPETGKVLFTSFLQENELLSTGQPMFYVQPQQSQYYGQLMVAQRGMGKIKTGQKVFIRLESYPSSEFGYLTGIVNYIPSVPSDKDSFLIKVDLPNGLQTSYNKNIGFRNDLLATADIITDNRRLLNRLLGQLTDIFR